MPAPRPPSLALFKGPFSRFFATRLVLVCALASVAGAMLALQHFYLGALAWFFALAVATTLVVRTRLAVDAVSSTTSALQTRAIVQSMECSAHMAFIADKNNRVTWVNHAFCGITGYAAKDALGKSVETLLGHAAALHWPTAANHVAPLRMDIPMQTAKWEHLWCDTEVRPLLDDRNAFAGTLAIGCNITAQKTLLDRLQAQAPQLHRLASILRNTKNAVVFLGPDGAVAWFNASAPDVLGIDAQALAHFTAQDIERHFHERHSKKIQAATRADAEQNSRLQLELACDHRGRWLDAEFQPLFVVRPDSDVPQWDGWAMIACDVANRQAPQYQWSLGQYPWGQHSVRWEGQTPSRRV